MGIDYSSLHRRFEYSTSAQFLSSAYGAFLLKAADFLATNYPDYASVVREASQKFTIADTERDQILADRGGNQRGLPKASDDSAFQLAIQGIKDELDDTVM
jgi:hypothetical protein